MKAIAQLVVRLFDLVEAEGRSLRSVVRDEARVAHAAATNIALGLALLVMAIPLCIGGITLLAVSFMWWLETQVSPALAACLTGLVILAAGVLSLASFRLIARRTSS